MPRKSRPLLFAITGGIATGKSQFSAFLREKGLTIYDTDSIGHEVLESPEVHYCLQQRWGEELIRDGKVDRKKLGEIVFADKAQLKELNAMVHPRIIKRMDELLSATKEKHLGFEIPLLFETGLQYYFDISILVTTHLDNQLERLQAKHINREEALQRISCQMPETVKAPQADVVVQNDGSIAELKNKAEDIYIMILASGVKAVKTFHDLLAVQA